MAQTLFTLPGKVGDNILKIPIAYQYAKQHDTKVDICLDLQSPGIVKLLETQLWVDNVFMQEGINDHYGLGGEPYNFGDNNDAHFRQVWDNVYHLGYRELPTGNITAFSVLDTPINTKSLLIESCIEGSENLPIDGIFLQAESSRPDYNLYTCHILTQILNTNPHWGENLVISLFKDTENDGIYQGFKKYNPKFIYSENLKDLMESMKGKVVFSTCSAASCLAYICKYPLIVCQPESLLDHFKNGTTYYNQDHYGSSYEDCFNALQEEMKHKISLNKYDYNYEKYSLGELIDALSIVNLKIFMLVDIVLNTPEDIESMGIDEIVKLAKASKKAALLNNQRSKLKNAIDKMVLGLDTKDVKI